MNVGVARAGVQFGVENRVEGEFMPYGGPFHARAGAGIGLAPDGVHSEVGAGANFFDIVNGDADFGVRLGPNIAVDGDVRGKVWPVDAQGNAGAGLGKDGAHAYTGGNVGVAKAAGVRAGAEIDVGQTDSGAAAGVGLRAGEGTVDFGPSIRFEGHTTIRPQLHLDAGRADRATFYPTGDRTLDSSR